MARGIAKTVYGDAGAGLGDGVRGLQQEQVAPQRELRSSRTDAQKIADTIAAETHAG